MRGRESSGAAYDAAVRLGGEWFNCDRLADARCAVALMVVPDGPAREQEEQRLRRGTRLLRERFGGIAEVKGTTTDARMAELVLRSGESSDPRSAKATFAVKFAKLSDGYIQIDACPVASNWKIRAIHYGLPLSNPSSAPMIDSVNADFRKVSP